MANKRYEIGIALSGGGVRCAAELGVLKCLDENDIKPNIISGTSGGAIVGALYADGHHPDDILEIFKKVKLFSISNYAFRKPGLIDIERFKTTLKKYLKAPKFEDLGIPLIVNATDLLKGEIVHFEKGNLIEYILASAAYPGVFTPVKVNGRFYADGGILENLPIQPIRPLCNFLIAVNVNAVVEIEESKIRNSIDVLNRALHLTISSQHNAEACDYLIEPKVVGNYGLFNLASMSEIFEHGYNDTKKYIKNIKKSIYKI